MSTSIVTPDLVMRIAEKLQGTYNMGPNDYIRIFADETLHLPVDGVRDQGRRTIVYWTSTAEGEDDLYDGIVFINNMRNEILVFRLNDDVISDQVWRKDFERFVRREDRDMNIFNFVYGKLEIDRDAYKDIHIIAVALIMKQLNRFLGDFDYEDEVYLDKDDIAIALNDCIEYFLR